MARYEPGGRGLANPWNRGICRRWLPTMTRCTGRAVRMGAISPPARCPGKSRLSRPRHRPRPCALPAVAQIPRSVTRSDAPNEQGGLGFVVSWEGNLWSLAAEDDSLHGQGGSDGSHIAAGSLPRQIALEPAATSNWTGRTAISGTIPRSATDSDEFRRIWKKGLTTLSTWYTLTSSN